MSNQLGKESSCLLIIDLQEKILTPITSKECILKNTKKLISTFKVFKNNILFTEQNPLKLGSCKDSVIDVIKVQTTYKKMTFSCFENKDLIRAINGSKNIIMAGIESHICIQQSAMDLISNGNKIYIAEDAIGSRNERDHKTAIKRMEKEGAIISSTESIIFEICKTANRSEFKSIINLIKS
tara:strand:- start:5116 stop:5661 length:546 start_codon:yes stop_codon:yes gene_type:complete